MRLFVLVAVFLMSGWAMAQSTEPSLADLSKQARERKAKVQKPARLITNADLKNFQNAPVSISKAAEEAQPADATKAEEKEPGPEEAAPADDLAYWKAKFQAAVLDYKNAINKGLVLQLRLNNMNNSFYQQTDDSGRERYEAEIAQTAREIENNKAEVAAAEKAIDDLRQEARAAGVEEADISAMIGVLPKPKTITDLENGDPGYQNP